MSGFKIMLSFVNFDDPIRFRGDILLKRLQLSYVSCFDDIDIFIVIDQVMEVEILGASVMG